MYSEGTLTERELRKNYGDKLTIHAIVFLCSTSTKQLDALILKLLEDGVSIEINNFNDNTNWTETHKQGFPTHAREGDWRPGHL